MPLTELAKLTGSAILDSDLLLFDNLDSFPMHSEPKRTSNIIVALCLEGLSKYTANTVEHNVGPDDVLIIHDGPGRTQGHTRAVVAHNLLAQPPGAAPHAPRKGVHA